MQTKMLLILVDLLKFVSAIFYQIFISPNDSPLKTMKNVFYFMYLIFQICISDNILEIADMMDIKEH